MTASHDPMRRRGVTLVELLLLITAMTATISLAASLLHRALRLESASRGLAQADRTALVLARQFRADIRAARGIACTADALPEGVVLRLEPAGGGEIVYRGAAGGLDRAETLSGGRVARESFRFPAEVRFAAARGDGIVSLTGDGGGSAGEGPPVEIEVVAAVGDARNEEEKP